MLSVSAAQLGIYAGLATAAGVVYVGLRRI